MGTASRDFILKNLITPPRPTPIKSSHRKSFHKKSLKKEQKLEYDSVDAMDEDDDIDDDDEKDENEMNENEQKYMFECCDIIISYISCLVDILSEELFETAHFIKIIMFSLPMLSHQYSPNAVSLNDVLLITHKWLKIKFMKNHELMHLQSILSHLQSKVLTTTYSNKNYAAIWKNQQQQGMDADDDASDDIIDID